MGTMQQIDPAIMAFIREDCPDVPDELKTSWLYGHYLQYGRPPRAENIPWLYKGHDLKWLQSLKWQKVSIPLSIESILGSENALIRNLLKILKGITPNDPNP